MKSIVIADDFHQSDLKPDGLLARYVGMLQADVAAYLLNGKDLTDVPCPACGGARRIKAGDKFGLHYQECADCGTLYISPRPGDEAVVRFYREAPSRLFWEKQISEATRVQRQEEIIRPRMEWVSDSTAEHCPRAGHWVGLHVNQPYYLDAMAAATAIARKTATCPYFDTAVMKVPSQVRLEPAPWWQMDIGGADVLTLFELLDQTADVGGLLAKVRGTLGSGGLCFITAILASGFDVKELGPHAPNIFPPDRLNVFSAKGIRVLLEKNGFELLEFSTPGVLDIEIVRKALKADPSLGTSAFVRDLVLVQSAEVQKAFQEFLQANMLSSYGRILARKQ